tara:strand:+ start:33937 stop:34785 length:849 start_codon:yes stop_codon:yes gene_type:complete
MNQLIRAKSLNIFLLTGFSLISLPLLAQSEMAEMQSQGINSLEERRDPHAYSGGTTLTEGPYVLEGNERLTLADEHAFYALLGDRFEYNEQANTVGFDLQAWYGTTFDRLVLKTEGEIRKGSLEENQTDILWGHAISTYWDTQAGVRFDYYQEGENRQWLAFGLQGLAPYWFDLDLTAYLNESGNTAFTLNSEYELLLTQKLILQPSAEITLYGKDDKQNNLGAGLSTSTLGFRMRYELTRQFSPYVGVEWTNMFGSTADFAKENGQSDNNTAFVAGIKFWF